MIFPPTSKSNRDNNFANDPIFPLHCISKEPIENLAWESHIKQFKSYYNKILLTKHYSLNLEI